MTDQPEKEEILTVTMTPTAAEHALSALQRAEVRIYESDPSYAAWLRWLATRIIYGTHGAA